jgi:hypothetical protein
MNAKPIFEARVTISGRELSFTQSMALRMAVSSIRVELNDPKRRKALGTQLSDNWDRHLLQVENMLIHGCNEFAGVGADL